MGLSQIVANLEAGMSGRVPGLAYAVGASQIGKNKRGNTVVFVPTEDDYAPAKQQRGVDRVSALRMVRLEVHLWGVWTREDNTVRKTGGAPAGTDIDPITQTERMVDALVNALDDGATGPNYTIESGSYEDQVGEGVTQNGVIYVLRLTLAVPVVYRPITAATSPGATQTGSLDEP